MHKDMNTGLKSVELLVMSQHCILGNFDASYHKINFQCSDFTNFYKIYNLNLNEIKNDHTLE